MNEVENTLHVSSWDDEWSVYISIANRPETIKISDGETESEAKANAKQRLIELAEGIE